MLRQLPPSKPAHCNSKITTRAKTPTSCEIPTCEMPVIPLNRKTRLNSCEPNTQIGRNLVFLNSLFCMCIPILFLSISYPWIVGILEFKRALTELLLLKIVVKENLVSFVPLLLRCRPPKLSYSNDRRVQDNRDPTSRLSFATSDLLPCCRQP